MGRSRRAYGLALAALVLGCVFTAVAGPRESLDSRTAALHRDLASTPSYQQVVQVSADWSTFADRSQSGSTVLYDTDLTGAGDQIGGALSAMSLPLASGTRAGLSTDQLYPTGGYNPVKTMHANVFTEVLYSDSLARDTTVVAGGFPAHAGAGGPLPVAVTTSYAAAFGLRPGALLVVAALPPVTVEVTAIVKPDVPSASFWTQDPLSAAPQLIQGDNFPFWNAAVLADPGTFTTMQNLFYTAGMTLHWEFPLRFGGLNADQAARLGAQLTGAAANPVMMTGDLAGSSANLSIRSGLVATLSAFADTDTAVQTVLSLLAISLAVTAAVMLVLTARLIATRRAVEFALLRARGASVRQVTALAARDTAIFVLPAALAGAALAVLFTPGSLKGPALGWWLGAGTVLVALAGFPAAVAWRLGPWSLRGTFGGRRRATGEIAACLAAAGGLVILHDQGTTAGSLNLYVAATPALVAVPAVIAAGRLYPLAVRLLLPMSARSRGVTGFLALAQAASNSLAGLGPALALVLTLIIGSFAGMVQTTVARGEVAASWQAAGADATVQIGGTTLSITPAVQRTLGAVPGVRHTAIVWAMPLRAGGPAVTPVVVDQASYAALVADTPFPAIRAGLLGVSGGSGGSGGVSSVLASPGAAALFGRGITTLDTGAGPVLRIRIAGTLTATAAAPGSTAFLVLPAQVLRVLGSPLQPSLLVTAGPGFSPRAFGMVVRRVLPGSQVSFRSTALAALTGAPLQASAYRLMRATLAVAAGFALVVVLLGLALGAADRAPALARLTAMGLPGARLGQIVLLEVLPALTATVLTAAACALTLPHLIAPNLDLTAFTGTGTGSGSGSAVPVTFNPDLAAVALPAAVLALVTAAAVAIDLHLLHRRGPTAPLRIGT